MEKVNMTIEFCIFELVHIPKFNLKLSFVFLDQISPKGKFRSKMEKVNMTIEFCIFELVHIPKFNLKLSFVFLDQISPKGIIPVKNGKSKHHH